MDNSEEKKNNPEALFKDLIGKAKIQHAWYVDMYPVHMRNDIAKRILQLEMNNVVCCAQCGIPSGLPNISMRTVKAKGENGKKQKISLCPKCINDRANKIYNNLNVLNQK